LAKKVTKVTPDNDKSSETTAGTSTSLPFWRANTAALWEDRSYTNPYDKVYLGGLEVPGLSVVKTGVSNSIDVQKTKGKSGSAITYNGTELADVDVTATIWMPRHIDMYQALLKLVQPGAAKKGLEPNVVPIQHPVTAALGILKVVVKELSGFDISGDGSEATFSIKLLQYEPPAPVQKAAVKKNASFQGSTFERTGPQQTDDEKKAVSSPPSTQWQELGRNKEVDDPYG